MSTENIILLLASLLAIIVIGKMVYSKFVANPNATLNKFTLVAFNIILDHLNIVSKEQKFNSFDDIINYLVPIATKELKERIMENEKIPEKVKDAITDQLIELFIKQTISLYKEELVESFELLTTDSKDENKEEELN